VAVPRRAWSAYAVLAEILGDRVISGGMTLPLVADRAELEAALATSNIAGIVVFEYEIGWTVSQTFGLVSWAYLVLRDTRTRPTVGVVRLLATPIGPTSGYWQIRIYGLDNPERDLGGGSDTTLPVIDVTPVPTTIPVAAFTVTPGWEPRLIVSPRQLSWQIVQGAASRKGLHERPEWLDDPGAAVDEGVSPPTRAEKTE
jgi:hypothetical protein